MTDDKYEKTRLKEGQKLLYKNEVVLFEEYDECYGRIVIRFDKPLYIKPPLASYGGKEVPIHTKVVSYEEVEIVGKIKQHR